MTLTSGLKRRRGKAAAFAAVLALGVAIAGGVASASGSTASKFGPTAFGASGGGLSAIKAEVARLERRPTSIGITTPIKGKVPKGKTLVMLGCGAPTCVALGKNMTQATKAIGWGSTIYINEGVTPQTVQAAWAQGIADKPSGILVSGGYPRPYYATYLAQAKAAHIPIVTIGDPLPAGGGVDVALDSSARYKLNGVRLAQFAIASTNGKAHVLVANVSAYTADVLMFQSMESYLKANCPGCSFTVYQQSATSTNPGGDTAVAVEANPNVNIVMSAFSDFAVGLPHALASIGRPNVKIVTQALDSEAVAPLQAGSFATVYGYPGPEIMWRVVDAFTRQFLHESTAPDTALTYPEWLVTGKNITPDLKSNAFAPLAKNYRQQYLKLWHIS
jgi:ABC-type sugar transport system substrate-binding protein